MRLSAIVTTSLRYVFSPGSGRSWSLKRIRGGIVGIALSLVPLVVVYQVADGMIQGISARYLETGLYHLRAVSMNGISENSVSAALADRVRQIPGVIYAQPEVQGLVLAGFKQRTLGITVRAVPPEIIQDRGFARYLELKSGVFDLSDPQNVVLGQEVAQTLRAEVGDRVRLVSGTEAGGIPRISSFTVVGIVSSGYQELDRLWSFISLDRGRKILPAVVAEEFLAIKVADPYGLPNPLFPGDGAAANRTESGIFSALGSGWRVYSWFELSRDQFLSFVTTRNLLLFIMLLIVLVASVNVSSSMIMLVMEKQQEIAILKSLGAGPAGVGLIFVLAGGITGAIGAVLGLAVGAAAALGVNEIIKAIEWCINGVSWLIYRISDSSGNFESIRLLSPEFYLQRIPIHIHFDTIALIFGLTVGLSLLVSWFPATRAARLRPLAVLRKT